MATSEEHPPERELFETRYGNDAPPLMSIVPEPPPTHWGVTTSTARTLSPQYIEFLRRHRESKGNG